MLPEDANETSPSEEDEGEETLLSIEAVEVTDVPQEGNEIPGGVSSQVGMGKKDCSA